MLNFQDVAIRRGPRLLFSEATFGLFRGEKVGITGENGSGKSSLMSLVRGEIHPDTGTFEMPGNLEIAHVSQELDATDQDGAPYFTAEERDQELHLLYVAATRARRRLEPNEGVRSCLAARPAPAVAERGQAA